MPTRRSKSPSARKPNSSPPTLTPKQLRAEKRARDYPSFVQQASPNPLLETPTHTLNPQGMVLQRLGLTEADIADVPDVMPTVKKALGSTAEAIELLRADDAPDSRKFIRKWDSLSETDQKRAKFEHIIVAAGLTTRRFMELIAGAEFDHSGMVEKLFASRSRLKVMQSTVRAATEGKAIFNDKGEIIDREPGDVKAMEIFHKITGALPSPKPSNFIYNSQINSNNRAETVEPKSPLQAMDAFLLEIDDVRKPKQIAARSEPEIPVETPENAPEIEYLDLGEVS